MMKKKLISGLLSIFILFFICACSDIGASPLIDVTYPEAVAFDAYDIKREVREQNPVEDNFLSALTNFSYETASAALRTVEGNANYSPLSLYFALALAGTGANGETQSQIFDLLGIFETEEISVQCGNLYRRLYTDHKIAKLKIANSIWLDNNTVFNDDFVQNAARKFYALAYSVDFADESAGKAMSQWVSDNTNGNLASDFQADGEQILSIINTVYFFDEWIDRFNKDKTAEDVFHAPDGDVTVDFMNQTFSSKGFVRGTGFTRSALGLKGSGQMVFILPDESVSVSMLLSSAESVRELFEGGKRNNGKVVWQLPKFSFDTKSELTDMLKTLGMTDAFKQNADFSGITGGIAYITNVTQQTHISIDENGVEASAFTKMDYAGAARPDDRAEMILNRPFIYGITARNGVLLFVGVCNNPAL